MALFGWRKSKDDEAPRTANDGGNVVESPNGGEGDSGEFKPDPAKARKWFIHAKTAADSYQYEYAIWCYANGIRFDPEEMAPHVAMYESAIKFISQGGKPAPGKDIRKLDGNHPVHRFTAAEFAWMRDMRSGSAAMRLLDACAKADLHEFGRWVAPKIYTMLRQAKKPSKSDFLKAMKLMGAVGAWDQAIACGETAYALDPTDGELQAELKNFAAQRAMDQGGYSEAAGEEGGFRKFIRDADKQRELEESEAISGNASIEERNVYRAKTAYEENPGVPDLINKYALTLKKQGTPETEQLAYDVYMKGFADTGEYRFRVGAGDIKISQLERLVEAAQARAEAAPDDAALRDQFTALDQELLTLKANEYSERVTKYPTDRRLKFLAGEVSFRVGRIEEAMANFQAAKDDPKLRVVAGHLLGLCFEKDGWHDVAIGEFKEALDKIDASERERELDIRYDLMVSLINQARKDSSLDLAKEALENCSMIARKNITYRDIRQRRREIDDLIKDLSGES